MWSKIALIKVTKAQWTHSSIQLKWPLGGCGGVGDAVITLCLNSFPLLPYDTPHQFTFSFSDYPSSVLFVTCFLCPPLTHVGTLEMHYQPCFSSHTICSRLHACSSAQIPASGPKLSPQLLTQGPTRFLIVDVLQAPPTQLYSPISYLSD